MYQETWQPSGKSIEMECTSLWRNSRFVRLSLGSDLPWNCMISYLKQEWKFKFLFLNPWMQKDVLNVFNKALESNAPDTIPYQEVRSTWNRVPHLVDAKVCKLTVQSLNISDWLLALAGEISSRSGQSDLQISEIQPALCREGTCNLASKVFQV